MTTEAQESAPLDRSRSLSGIAMLAIVVTAILYCMSDLLVPGQLPVYRDLLPFVLPYRWFLAEHLARGDLPLWNPFIHLGVPFLASLHASALYPPSLLLLVPFPLGFNVFLLAHYGIGGLGVDRYLRSRGLSSGARAVGVLVFVVGGYLVSCLTNTAHLQAAVWIPWILFAWSRLAAGPTVGRVATLGVLLAVELVAGAPEVSILTIVLLGAVWMRATVAQPSRGFELGVALVVAVVAAFGLAAVQLLPTLEYLQQSRRTGVLGYGEVTHWSIEPASLLQFLLPHSPTLAGAKETGALGPILESRVPLFHSLYIGILGLIAVITGIAYGRDRWLWGGIGVVAVLLALGDYSPLFRVLHAVIPEIILKFRYPEKFLVLAHVAFFVLAAEGAERWFRSDRKALRTAIIAALTLGLVVAAISVVGRLRPDWLLRAVAVLSGHANWASTPLVSLALDTLFKAERAVVLIGLWLCLAVSHLRGVVGAVPFGILALLLLATDLAPVHRGMSLSVPADRLDEAPFVVDVEKLRASHQRIFHYETSPSLPGFRPRRPSLTNEVNLVEVAVRERRALFADIGMLFGVGNLSGFDSIGEKPLLEGFLGGLSRSRAVALLGTWGVARLIGTDPLELPDLDPEPSDGSGFHVYSVRDARPWAYLSSGLEVVPRARDALIRLADPGFLRSRHAIVDNLPESWEEPLADPVNGGAVEVVSRENEFVELIVTTGERALLVVNEEHFPGWTATIDGRPTAIARANVYVRGIMVPPGRHHVRMVYRPLSFRVGMAVSIATGLVLALAWVASRRGAGRRGSLRLRIWATPGRGRHSTRN